MTATFGFSGKQYYKSANRKIQDNGDLINIPLLASVIQGRGAWGIVWQDSDTRQSRYILVVTDSLYAGSPVDTALHYDLINLNADGWISSTYEDLLQMMANDSTYDANDIARAFDPRLNGF